MKKQMSILMVMMMIVAPLAALPIAVGGADVAAEAPLFSGAGSGTPGDPYQITNDTQLQEMELELAAHYILVNDIDASITSTWNTGAGFTPIGDQATPFMGSFEGQNYSISDLFINLPSGNSVGMFGSLGGGSYIGNTTLINTNVTGEVNVAILAGTNGGKIENCRVSGSVSGGNVNVGGLVGWNSGTIEFSISDSDISGSGDVGGLVGDNAGGTISYSHALGDVDASVDYAGGLVGNNRGTIIECFATGDVTGGGSFVGGLVGGETSAGDIDRCYASGNVYGGSSVGGFIGINVGPIDDCYATGNATGSSLVGGFIGEEYDVLTNCYSSGNVTGTSNTGGFAGSSVGAYNDCFWDNETSGQESSAGEGPGAIEGKNTTDMMNNFTYTNAGWDLTNIWFSVSNSTRPFLRMEYDTTIRNSHQLQLMCMDIDADYTLANDIDLSDITNPASMWGTSVANGKGFYPIYDDTLIVPMSTFSGIFDGAGHSITGLYINRSTGYQNGLFGFVNPISEFKNVNLVDVDITGHEDTGALVGLCMGALKISNVTVTGMVSGGTDTGGLVGETGGIIENCMSDVSITGTNNVGGLAGLVMAGSTILDCTSSGSVAGSASLGGLIGRANGGGGGTITNCTAYGTVTGSSSSVGGLIGFNDAFAITGSKAYGTVNAYATCAGLIGYSNGIVTDCIAYGDVVGAFDNVGGLVGYGNAGSLTECIAYGNVTGPDHIGGLMGSGRIPITNCTSYGIVTGTRDDIGGLIGYYFSQTVTGSEAYGNVTVDKGDNVGGLIGYNTGTVIDCHTDSYVANDGNNTGGLIGYNNGPVSDSTSSGDIFNPMTVNVNIYSTGGLIGELAGSTVSFCEAYGDVTGNKFMTGGLIGLIANGAILMNSSAHGITTGSMSYIGGLVGRNGGTIINSSAYGDTGAGAHPWVGGLVGDNQGLGLIQNSSAHGDVFGTSMVGGFVGLNLGLIERCFSTGSADGSAKTGGFVGQNGDGGQDGDIIDCYSQGDVTAGDKIGGFAGNQSHATSTMINVYSTGQVTGTTNIGGLVGFNWDGTTTDGHWDTETSGLVISDGGIGNTDMEMMQQATFSNWNFTNVWGIHEYNSYPFLLPFGVPPEPVADMEITLTDSVDPATVGEIFSYFVTLENHGPDNAANILINITLPAEVTYHSANQTGMVVNGRYITAVVSVFEGGEVGGVQINVTLDTYSASPLNCTAFVTSSTLDPGVYANETYELTETNRAPTAQDQNYQCTEDFASISWAPGVLGGAADLDGDLIEVIGHEASDFGASITIEPDGNFTYDPTVSATLQNLKDGESLNDTFTYTISDGRGGFATATITMQVDGINGAPTANNDTFVVDEDSGPYDLDVLANDVGDEEGDAFSITHGSGATHGTLAVSADGSMLIYTPYNTNYTGYDVFTYMISDGNVTDTASVNLTITPVNDAPFAQGSLFMVNEDSGPNTLYVLAGAVDAEGDDLVISAITQPNNGIIVITESGKNLTYEPDADFFGDDFFNCTVSDGNGGTDTMMISLQVASVNDDPIIITTTLPDGIVGIPYSFTMNATDIDSAILGWGGASYVDWLTIQATGVLSGTPTAAGTFQVDIIVNDGDGGIVRTNLSMTITDSADPGTDTDGDGEPDITDPDDDDDGVTDDLDAFPLDDTEDTDTDGDGTGDNADAFPDDIAASVDADGDGAPDEWNDGYTADDSTTGLVIDDDVPDIGDGDDIDDDGGSNWLYIILILVVVGVIAFLLIMKGKGKETEPVDEAEPDAPIEEAIGEVPEEMPEEAVQE
ncbi:MAG: tandem-95 repeat protein [Thermoplasmata archaeon]|nr:tandem-95 repeat protein [Thermoplasmata archaeon]